MKKIVFILVSLVAVFFASCSNDDITITTRERVNFKINPSGVVSPFTWEYSPGELESFDSQYKLRVRLLVYDTNSGMLISQETQYLTNYASLVNVPMDLVLGDYTVVAISDVVKYEGGSVSFEFWTLSNENILADTQIKDNGKIGAQYKILGIANAKVSIYQEKEEEKEVSLSLLPAGALMFVNVRHMNTFSNAIGYGVDMNRTSEFIQFYNNGDYKPSIENNNNEYDWWLSYFDVDESYPNLYNYFFIIPMNNVSFRFVAETNDGIIALTKPMVLNVKAGEEYAFTLDLNSENGIVYNYELVNGSNRSVECVSRMGAAIRADGFSKSNVSLKSLLK